MPRFLQQALTGGSLVIFGDGSQSRDFVYVDDVVAALVTAATAKAVNRQVINIGSGVETSITELVDAIEQVNGRRLLLGTGCVAMTTTPLRNIRALREIVEQ